jgi:N-acetyl sugar amidotransferase
MKNNTKILWCRYCTCPSSSALPLTFDGEGVCSACLVQERLKKADWRAGRDALKKLVSPYRSSNDYDILIPVSGGKDSYYQTHVAVKELGLKPLLVTYHGNNYLPEGEYNLQRMREVFNCDHIIVRPSVDVLIKLNRIGFKMHGDMNWHNHAGIETVPCQIAVRHKIPLVMWGEHGGLDISGMFQPQDQVEFTKKFRLEHALHGFDWYDFTDEGLEKMGRPELKEGLSAKDLKCYQYPSDDDVIDSELRGVYLGNFYPWDANKHVKLMKEIYGWRQAQKPFERTYRLFSNLDDMHENGIHDYMKFIKFGYGRGTDHSSKDIRAGYMTREKGVAMVQKYDHIKPRFDLERWLDYVGMNEEEFDIIADTFRDKRVWRIENGCWVKDDIGGDTKSFGPVHR